MKYYLLFLVVLIVLVPPLLGSQQLTAEQAMGRAHEIPQMPGFPVDIGPYQPGPSSRGVVLADLDNDGDLELVYAHHACPELPMCGLGQISAWDYNGNILPGFPVALEHVQVEAPPAVADLDGDGDQEIVLMTYTDDLDQSVLFAFDHLGNSLAGFPITVEANYGFVTLYDINLDGHKEILYTSFSGLWAVRHDGTQLGGSWPLDLTTITGGYVMSINGHPSIADADGDGRPEIALMVSRTSLFLVSTDGEVLDGWPKTFAPKSSILGNSAIFADLDGDADLEVIFVRNVEGASISNSDRKVEVHVFHHNGDLLAGWPQEILPDHPSPWRVSLPTITDLDGDDELDIVVAASHNPRASSSAYGHGARIFAWDKNGSLMHGFPYRPHPHWKTGAISMITAVDSDGDGAMELYADAAHSDDDMGYLLGVDAHGRNLHGFPLRPLGSTSQNGAIIADVDADGDYEIAVTGMTFREANGYMLRLHLYDLPSAYGSTDLTWPTYHANNHRDGYLKRRYKGWRFVRGGTRMGGGR